MLWPRQLLPECFLESGRLKVQMHASRRGEILFVRNTIFAHHDHHHDGAAVEIVEAVDMADAIEDRSSAGRPCSDASDVIALFRHPCLSHGNLPLLQRLWLNRHVYIFP